MKLDRTAVWFGMSDTGRTIRRGPLARLAPQSAVLRARAHTGSDHRPTTNQAIHAPTSQRNAQPKRRRHRSVMTIALVAVLLPLATVAGSKPYVWAGGQTITVRDFTSNTFDGIVQQEVAAWSAIMPGGTRLRYSRESVRDCSVIGSLRTNSVALGEIWVCSTASVGGKDTWGYGYAYTLDRLIVRGYVELEERGPKTQFERYGIVCHELGHTLGLRHMKGRRTCMNANRVKRDFPGPKDKAALAKRYLAAGSP